MMMIAFITFKSSLVPLFVPKQSEVVYINGQVPKQ